MIRNGVIRGLFNSYSNFLSGLSGFVMVLKRGGFYFIVRAYVVSLNRQQERRFILCYQKKYLSSMANAQKSETYIRKKINKFIEWYDEVTGMDEVRMAQRRVLEDEEQFRKAQEDRRKVLNELTDIQQKLKDLYSELENTVRGDDRYLVLIKIEHKLLKDEKVVLEKFSRAEKLERDTFAALSSSVKLSHEKERAQSERTKYWSVIGSVLGTVLGILGSSVNSHFKMNELKQLIKNSTNMQLIDCLNEYLETNEKIIEKIQHSVKPSETVNVAKIEEMLKTLNSRLTDIKEGVKKVEKNTDTNIKVVTDSTEGAVVVPAAGLEKALKKDYAEIKVLLVSIAVLSLVMPIVSKYS